MPQELSRTKKEEYAAKLTLIGVFLSVFAAFASRLGIWQRDRREFELKPFDFILLAFSTLRLGRLISYDHVTEPLRHPFTQTVPDPTGAGDTVAPRQESGLKKTVGQLISCPICSGTWVAAALVYGLNSVPRVTRSFLAIMGTVGLAEVLNEITEALSWSAQLARSLSGQIEKGKKNSQNGTAARRPRTTSQAADPLWKEIINHE